MLEVGLLWFTDHTPWLAILSITIKMDYAVVSPPIKSLGFAEMPLNDMKHLSLVINI